jgi:hypothetical protein
MRVPPGTHEIVFTFEPKSYLMGEKVDFGFSILLVLALLGALWMQFRPAATQAVIGE